MEQVRAVSATTHEDLLLGLARQRVDLLVRRAALRQRLLGGDPSDPYRGLLLSDEEVDQLLRFVPGEAEAELADPTWEELGARLALLEHRLEQLGTPPESRLGRLCLRLGLTSWERDVLVLALLPEIDPRYGRLLAFLQDDVTQQRPTVLVALRLFGGGASETLERTEFHRAAPLLHHRLVHLSGHPPELLPPLLQRAIRLDERIAAYLLDGEGADVAPFPFLRRARGGRPLADLLFAAEVVEPLGRLQEAVARGQTHLLLLEGAEGSGRRTAARSLARELGRPLLEVVEPMPADLPPLERARLALREACLQGGVLFWPEEEGRPALGPLGELAAEYRVPLLLAGEHFSVTGRLPPGVARIAFPQPDAAMRGRLWEIHLAGRPCSGVRPEDLALRFRLNGGQIRASVSWAEGVASRHGRLVLEQADLEEAVSAVATPTLGGLARPVQPRHTWEEIVLPADVVAHLREFTAAIRSRDQVYEAWGFDRRRPFGRGLNALFAGPSGTGKTMAAEIMAHELGLALFKIDLSAVVSKYVGETEKHLQRIFAEAERGNAILFFDEADALFGKRSEVRDAHDRYANIEVAYLLQALEEHAGVAILATNLYGNMDDAFVRRMHYIVHFPFPEEEMRRGIWQVIFPQQAPLSQDIDFVDLARRFRVTGGHIRNIALGAAFLAADDGGMIDMDHLLRAARREFQKMGKVVDEADFGSAVGPAKE